MAGRRINVMVVVNVDEDTDPDLFERCRTTTAVELNNSISWLYLYMEDHARVVGIEHFYER